jgi:hypothetical protein
MTDPHRISDIAVVSGTGLAEAQSGNSDLQLAIKRAAANDVRECRRSRAQIADELSSRTGRSISVAQIDAYLAETKSGHRFPCDLLPAWVQVTGSRRVLDILCAAAGYCLADQTERELAELGRECIRREKSQSRLEALKGDLWHRVS